MIRFLLENSKAKFGIWLGDTIPNHTQWSSATMPQYLQYAGKLLRDSNKVFFTFGNHDRMTGSGVDKLPIYMFNDFLADKYEKVKASYRNAFGTVGPDGLNHADIDDMIMDWLKQYYYFIDDVDTQTRYMMINTHQYDQQSTMVTDAQLAWISHCVQFGTGYENWNLVVFAHADIDTNSVFEGRDLNKVALIRKAIAGTNGRIVGFFCGHQHLDYYLYMTSAVTEGKRIDQVLFLCDKLPGDEGVYPGYSYPPDRTEGTITEQAITVVSFNRTTSQVVLRRIGAVTPGMTTCYYYPS